MGGEVEGGVDNYLCTKLKVGSDDCNLNHGDDTNQADHT